MRNDMTNEQKGRLWVRLVKHHRVVRDAVTFCEHDEAEDALRELLPKLDISQPVWLPRHREDWAQFSLAHFRPEDFVDAVDFDKMELSYIFSDKQSKPARRRNVLEDV